MRKAICLLLSVISFLSATPVFAEAVDTGDTPMTINELDYAFNVFSSIQWGDDVEKVVLFLGNGKPSTIDIVTQLSYGEVDFGPYTANDLRCSFIKGKLTSIYYLFILPEDNMFDLLVTTFTQEIGEPTANDRSVDESGNEIKSTVMWVMHDETEIAIERDRNAITLTFQNNSVTE